MSLEEKNIKKIVADFFEKITFNPEIKIDFSLKETEGLIIDVNVDEPQILIGEKGQTLNEIQALLTKILNKNQEKFFYVNLDINDYKKKKTDYLKSLAKELADEVSLTNEKRYLPPMSSYERRIVHLELSKRGDVVTESEGEGKERKVVIKPR